MDNQEFCSVDPFIDVYKLAEGRSNLFKNYPLHLPLNFVAGYAEFLPFRSSTFNTVNMRSCIDHFFNPELSLLETYRVLKDNGKLIIGMTVDVNSMKNFLKETGRKILNLFTKRFQDKHIWHPSRYELIAMCKKCGFDLEDEIWQNENVWYASFRKISTELVRIT
jgi:ubiquinone/menaquinone biosynthesis C-methylase UbiE